MEISKHLCATSEVDDLNKLTQQAKLLMTLENCGSGTQAAEWCCGSPRTEDHRSY